MQELNVLFLEAEISSSPFWIPKAPEPVWAKLLGMLGRKQPAAAPAAPAQHSAHNDPLTITSHCFNMQNTLDTSNILKMK